MDPTLEQRAREWLELDRNPQTRDEISKLLANEEHEELKKRLTGRIAFGTAGLRARMEAGFTRMNSLTVIQASQGLASYILKMIPDAVSQGQGVVIGHDARWNSEHFARLAATAFLSQNLKVYWHRTAVPTPLVPFGITQVNASAGVMVTASHNPAQDNGYKVYWTNGCQIIPPHDIGIAQEIEVSLRPWPNAWSIDTVWKEKSHLVVDVLQKNETAYYSVMRAKLAGDEATEMPDFVYTPMHGVGLKYLSRAVQAAFLQGDVSVLSDQPDSDNCSFTVVTEQAQPDPAFPSVEFPNPEESGALDMAIKAADAHNIRLIVANDPDADRLSIAEKLADGSWHQFTGNQIGVLLASSVLEQHCPKDSLSRRKFAMLASTVSTGMLRAIAEREGFHFAETLTGFKWIGNVAQDMQCKDDYTVPFGFEEAIGYMFTDVSFDKDGIAGAITFLKATARWNREFGLTPWQQLQKLYTKYGFFADANTYFISPSADVTTTVFRHIRSLEPGRRFPTYVGAKKIVLWRDLTLGYDSGTSDNVPELPVDKSSEMITCELDDGTRFTVRASGTEPKIKLYIESQGNSHESALRKALETRGVLSNEWFKPEVFALTPA